MMLFSEAVSEAISILGDAQIAKSLSVAKLSELLGERVSTPEEEAEFDAQICAHYEALGHAR